MVECGQMMEAGQTSRDESAEQIQRAAALSVEQRKIVLHGQILKFATWILFCAGLPYFIWDLWRATREGDLDFVTIATGIGFAILTIGASVDKIPLRIRRLLVVFGVTLCSVMALFGNGANLGTGLIFATATLSAAVFLGPGAAAITTTTLLLVLVGFTLEAYGVIPKFIESELDLSPNLWERITVTAAITLFALAYVFSYLVSELWRSLTYETAMRVRERQVERERQEVLNSAAAAQRLESLGRLAGGVAHDFNNALVVIQCGVSELRLTLKDPSTREVLDELDRGIERAASTARQLLSFARRNAEEVGLCDPKPIVEGLIRDALRILPAHIHIEHELEAVGEVAIAASSLEQILLNLILNARDALPVGGKITLRLRDQGIGEAATLEIEDNGHGMSPEIRERAFEPFFTTKGDSGTGLGLAMVWGTMNRVGGSVSLHSEPGKGTRVTLTIPYAEPSSSTSMRLQVADLKVPSGRERILVLEDEPAVQRAIHRILTAEEYEVTCVMRVAEARKALAEHDYSMLLTDGIVPDGGVGELVEEFRTRTLGAPVIVCSGYVEEELALSGIASGRVTFLAKPFTPAALTNIVRDLLSRDQARRARYLSEFFEGKKSIAEQAD